MMADSASLQIDYFYNSIYSSPIGKIMEWISTNPSATIDVTSSMFSVPGSASDLSIPVDFPTTTKIAYLYDTDLTGTTLTVKTNGDTDARAVKPHRILSEQITTLTVSNSSTSTKYLGIVTINTSDDTNVSYTDTDYAV